MFKKFKQTNFYRTIYTFVQMYIIDNLRPIFKKECKEKQVVIKDRYGNKGKYLLRVSEGKEGPSFFIKNYVGVGDAHILVNDSGCEFLINVFDKNNYNKHIGTTLMNAVIEWASKHKVDYIYGTLATIDKEKNNWEHSLPFYLGLEKKIPKIKGTFLLPYEPDFLKDKNTIIQNAVDIDFIKSSNSGYIVFTLS